MWGNMVQGRDIPQFTKLQVLRFFVFNKENLLNVVRASTWSHFPLTQTRKPLEGGMGGSGGGGGL